MKNKLINFIIDLIMNISLIVLYAIVIADIIDPNLTITTKAVFKEYFMIFTAIALVTITVDIIRKFS